MSISLGLMWFLIGVVFLVIELLIPGFIFIFFTAGAWVTALVGKAIDLSLTAQIVVFILSSLILLFTLRKYSIATFKGDVRNTIDDHYADAKLGKTAEVTKAILPGKTGEIKVMGSFWMATADESIKEGESVIIVSQDSEDGLTFKVKKA